MILGVFCLSPAAQADLIDHAAPPGFAAAYLQALPKKQDTAGRSEKSSALTDKAAGILNSIELKVSGLPDQKLWSSVRERVKAEALEFSKCEFWPQDCSQHILNWIAFLHAAQKLTQTEKLDAVLTFARNTIKYREDRSLYRKADYWASPHQTLKGYGDCEDFAILKYVSLVRLGINQESLRVVVVRSRSLARFHAVLVAEIDNRRYVLDSLSRIVKQEQSAQYYTPVRSYTGDQAYLHIPRRVLATAKPSTDRPTQQLRLQTAMID